MTISEGEVLLAELFFVWPTCLAVGLALRYGTLKGVSLMAVNLEREASILGGVGPLNFMLFRYKPSLKRWFLVSQ